MIVERLYELVLMGIDIAAKAGEQTLTADYQIHLYQLPCHELIDLPDA